MLPMLWDVITAWPVLVVMVVHFSLNMGYYALLNEVSDFMSKALPVGRDIASNGLYSALPFITISLTIPLIGTISEYAVNQNVLTRINSQRICISIGCLFPAAGILGMTYLTSEATQYYCIALLAVSFGLYGARVSAVEQNYNGLAPNRSGLVCGVVNGFANLAGFLVPLIKDWVVQDDRDGNL